MSDTKKLKNKEKINPLTIEDKLRMFANIIVDKMLEDEKIGELSTRKVER